MNLSILTVSPQEGPRVGLRIGPQLYLRVGPRPIHTQTFRVGEWKDNKI